MATLPPSQPNPSPQPNPNHNLNPTNPNPPQPLPATRSTPVGAPVDLVRNSPEIVNGPVAVTVFEGEVSTYEARGWRRADPVPLPAKAPPNPNVQSGEPLIRMAKNGPTEADVPASQVKQYENQGWHRV